MAVPTANVTRVQARRARQRLKSDGAKSDAWAGLGPLWTFMLASAVRAFEFRRARSFSPPRQREGGLEHFVSACAQARQGRRHGNVGANANALELTSVGMPHVVACEIDP